MSSKFEFEIVTADDVGDQTSSQGHNIVTIEMPKEQAIHEFDPVRLLDDRNLAYSEHKRGFVGGEERRNARFRLNGLTRAPLSVEKEEEARIELEVQERVKARLESLRKVELESSRREGLEQGMREARQQVSEAAKPLLEKFEHLVGDFEGLKFEVFKANEDFLIRLMNRVARSVILRELKEDQDYTRRLVTQILDRLGTRENIKIYVGQMVYSAAEQLKADLAQTLGQLNNIAVELDAEILDRGCRVETDFGEVDARIEVQIQNISKNLGASDGDVREK